VSADEVETALSQWFASDLESIDAGVVLGDEESVTTLHFAQSLCWVDTSIPFMGEFLCEVLDSPEVDWGSVKE